MHSLYTETAIAPPDSLLTDLDALVFDLQDVGTRTWTYVGSMIYAMRAAARRHLPIIVLDRPNPITGNSRRTGARLRFGERQRAERRPSGEAVRIISVPIAAWNDDGRDGALLQ